MKHTRRHCRPTHQWVSLARVLPPESVFWRLSLFGRQFEACFQLINHSPASSVKKKMLESLAEVWLILLIEIALDLQTMDSHDTWQIMFYAVTTTHGDLYSISQVCMFLREAKLLWARRVWKDLQRGVKSCIRIWSWWNSVLVAEVIACTTVCTHQACCTDLHTIDSTFDLIYLDCMTIEFLHKLTSSVNGSTLGAKAEMFILRDLPATSITFFFRNTPWMPSTSWATPMQPNASSWYPKWVLKVVVSSYLAFPASCGLQSRVQ